MLSVVVPVYNNGGTLQALVERCQAVAANIGWQIEFCFVDDRSSDDSRRVLAGLSAPHIKVIENSARSGQHASIMRGLREASGEVVCVMDADLQDPPEALAALIAALGHADCAFARRVGYYTRLGRYLTGRAFFLLRGLLGGPPYGTGTYLVARRSVVELACAGGGDAPYIPSLLFRCATQVAIVPVQRARREIGRSGYTSMMRVQVAASALMRTLAYRGMKR